MTGRPPSWTILGTHFVPGQIPEETAPGLSLLLKGFQDPDPRARSSSREVRFSVRMGLPLSPEDGPGKQTPRWALELSDPPEPDLRVPLPAPDPREVELALVRQAMERTREILVLHAAALARDGRSVLVLGESGAGKTTLSLLLRSQGWTLLSDDLAPFHIPDARLLPFPRALHVDGEYPPEALAGLRHSSRDFPPDYAPFPSPFDPSQFHPGNTALPSCLLYLLPRAGPEGARLIRREAGFEGAKLGEADRGGASPPGGLELHPLPGSEVAQILHRSVIRTAKLEADKVLPFLIELGKGMRGFQIGGRTPRAAFQGALRALESPPRRPSL